MKSLLTNEQVSKLDFDNDHINITIDLSKQLKKELVTCHEIISYCNGFLENRENSKGSPLNNIFTSMVNIFSNIQSEYETVSSKIDMSISGKCDCYIIMSGSSQCYIGGDGQKHCTCCEACCP